MSENIEIRAPHKQKPHAIKKNPPQAKAPKRHAEIISAPYLDIVFIYAGGDTSILRWSARSIRQNHCLECFTEALIERGLLRPFLQERLGNNFFEADLDKLDALCRALHSATFSSRLAINVHVDGGAA
ncbi:MAG: hypothetical protein ACLPWS_17945 [Rhodomicrobium sp.]